MSVKRLACLYGKSHVIKVNTDKSGFKYCTQWF